MNQLEFLVFPSEEKTIFVDDNDGYGGAHHYSVVLSKGFNNNKAEYVNDLVELQFVQKNEDGTIIPGLQSEQLAYILLDRCIKLNAKFPSDQNLKMMYGLNTFIDACEERVEQRMLRGVMGDLKK